MSQQNKDKKSNSLFKKITIATCLGLVFTAGNAFAEDDEGFQTVHHVYLDGKHIGKVSDQDIVEDIIKETVESEAESFEEDFTVTVGEDISYVTERVFNPKFDNNYVSNLLEEELTVTAETIELKIGEHVVGHFNTKEEAEEVILTYKLKYVDEDILDVIQEDKKAVNDTDEPEPIEPSESVDLKIGDSIILDVKLSDEVSLLDGKNDPEDILTVEQGVEMLEKGTLVEEKHQVQEGEVLGQIASNYDLTTKKLLELNPELNEDTVLQIGQEINVTELKPFVDVILIKEELQEETISYETEIIESDDLYKGEEEVRKKGSNGKKEVHYELEIRNGQVTNREVLDEKVLEEPVNEEIVKGTKVVSSRGTGNLSWPTIGGYVSSHVGERWGRMHKGIDIARPSNHSILAADNGVITEARYDGGFGNKIVIDHNNGMRTIYAHLSSMDVQVGQTVEKGQKIGVMGSTGNSTGVHLHFELYIDGVLQNPLDHL